jgi:hypothetical protein
MTGLGWEEDGQQREQGKSNGKPQIPPLRCEMTNKRTGNGKAKAKYRGLSTAAAKCAAFGRDDVGLMRCEWGAVEMTCLVGASRFGRDEVYEVSYEVPYVFEKLLAVTSVSGRLGWGAIFSEIVRSIPASKRQRKGASAHLSGYSDSSLNDAAATFTCI